MSNSALFLSINSYPEAAGVSKLNSPNADAAAIAKCLKDDYGYECKTLAENKCTKKSIKTIIRKFKEDLEPEDTLVLYLTGHGAENIAEEKGYFIPWDGEKDKADTWFNFDEFVQLVKETKAWTTIIFADLCNAGYFLHKRLQDTGVTDTRKFIYVLSSGLAGEKVDDGKVDGHSSFANALLAVLTGWGGIGMEEPPYSIKLTDLLPFVQREISGQNIPQWPIGGYLARDISTNQEYAFEPLALRLRPGLVTLLFYQKDPMVLTLGLGELLEVLNLRIATFGMDSLERDKFNRLDSRLQLLIQAKDQFGNIMYVPVKSEPLAEYVELGIKALIRLIKHTKDLYPDSLSLKKVIEEEMLQKLSNDVFLRSLSSIIVAFDRIPGAEEAFNQEKDIWNQSSHALAGMVLSASIIYQVFGDEDDWSHRLFESVSKRVGQESEKEKPAKRTKKSKR